MKAADKVTALRVILAPIFFILYLHPGMNSDFFGKPAFFAILWFLFICIELSDFFDGRIARRRNEVSDFGKLWDPFADTLVRVTYFLCFIMNGILPVVPFLVILFREFGILFIRVMMMQKGVAMGARGGGKLKAVFYALTGLSCLLSVTINWLGYPDLAETFVQAAIIVFILSMIIAVVSFADYYILYKKTGVKL